jgi:Helix-turn-helix domain
MSPYSNMKPNMLDGVQLRYNYRLYPAPAQRSALARAFGCARVVFNDGLRARQEAHRAGRPYLNRRGAVGAADGGEEDTGAAVAGGGVGGGAAAGAGRPERGLPELFRLAEG